MMKKKRKRKLAAIQCSDRKQQGVGKNEAEVKGVLLVVSKMWLPPPLRTRLRHKQRITASTRRYLERGCTFHD